MAGQDERPKDDMNVKDAPKNGKNMTDSYNVDIKW